MNRYVKALLYVTPPVIFGVLLFDYFYPLRTEYKDVNNDGVKDKIVMHRFYTDVEFGYRSVDGTVFYRKFRNPYNDPSPSQPSKSPRP